MTKRLLFIGAILCITTCALMAADVSGKWTYDQAGRNGNTTTTTLTLHVDGGKLTGSVSRPGRGGQGTMDSDISEGTVSGNTITFKTSQNMQGTAFVTSYTGTLDGDALKLDITRPGFNGGEPTKTSVVAKRAAT